MKWLRVRELVRKEFIQVLPGPVKNRPMLVIAPLIQMVLFAMWSPPTCATSPSP